MVSFKANRFFPIHPYPDIFSVNKTIQGWSLQILIHVLLSANKRPVLAKSKAIPGNGYIIV